MNHIARSENKITMNEIEKTIYELESSLLQPEVRSSLAKLNELLADDFMEFGSSGLMYNKQNVLERLPSNTDKITYTIENFEVKVLSESIIFATFKTDKVTNNEDKIISLRSSLWRKEGEIWKIFFHQGTPIK